MNYQKLTLILCFLFHPSLWATPLFNVELPITMKCPAELIEAHYQKQLRSLLIRFERGSSPVVANWHARVAAAEINHRAFSLYALHSFVQGKAIEGPGGSFHTSDFTWSLVQVDDEGFLLYRESPTQLKEAIDCNPAHCPSRVIAHGLPHYSPSEHELTRKFRKRKFKSFREIFLKWMENQSSPFLHDTVKRFLPNYRLVKYLDATKPWYSRYRIFVPWVLSEDKTLTLPASTTTDEPVARIEITKVKEVRRANVTKAYRVDMNIHFGARLFEKFTFYYLRTVAGLTASDSL